MAAGTAQLLLVEDDERYVSFIAAEITSAWPESRIEQTATLEQASRRLEASGIDCVLLDLGLPDASELQALHVLTERAPEVPIVVLTGRGDEGLALQAVAAGAQDFVLKGTVDGADLARIVRRALARKRASLRAIAHDALHDPLTGLPNRTLLLDRLGVALARGVRNGRSTGVLFFDLDHFKAVNDAHGHSAGDRLLRAVGGRISGAVRPSDTVARLGGDEYAAVLEGIDGQQDVDACLARVRQALAEPFSVAGDSIIASMSIGTAIASPGAGMDPEELLRRADEAMYVSKAARRQAPGDALEDLARLPLDALSLVPPGDPRRERVERALAELARALETPSED